MYKLRTTQISALAMSATLVGLLAWSVIGFVTFDDLTLDYYAEFRRAQRAIERAVPPDRIEYSGVNRDLTLEEFHFKVTTASGRVVRVWFDGSNMDVRQVCDRPVGVIIYHANYGDRGNRYKSATVAGWIAPGTSMVTLEQILLNIDAIEGRVGGSAGDDNDALLDDPYSWDCLRIEFSQEQELGGYRYTGVTERDVADDP